MCLTATPVVLPFWASWLRLALKLQQNKMFPRRTKAAVADSQQHLRLIKSTSAPAGGLKGRVASFELTCPALVVTWDVECHGKYRSDQPTAPPEDRRPPRHLSGCDLWSERPSLYKPGCTISAACLEVTPVMSRHKKRTPIRAHSFIVGEGEAISVGKRTFFQLYSEMLLKIEKKERQV